MARFIFSIALFFVLSNNIYSQTDTISLHKQSVSYFCSPGIGICSKGFVTGFAFIVVSSNGWGGDIDYKINFFKSEKLPDDFSDGNANLIIPRDIVNVLSFNILKEFSISSSKFKIGIDVGPSFIFYNYVNFKLNPEYPNEFKAENKYLKERTSNQALGFSCSTKLKYLTSFGGLQMSLFAVVNKIKPVIGLEFCFNFQTD